MSSTDNLDDQNRPQFGAPIDRSQETYEPSPYAPRKSLPHGDVSPDGERAWPEPSQTSKVLTWGGVAVAAAAVTAGGILAVQKVVDLVTGDDEPVRRSDRVPDSPRGFRDDSHRRPRGSLAPRYADMSHDERDQMRDRQRRREDDMDQHTRSIRSQAGRPSGKPRRPQMGLIDEIEHTAQRLSDGAERLVSSLSAAMAGFRQVARQAQGVMQEFHSTADQIRGFVNTSGSGAGGAGQQDNRAPDAGSFSRARRSDVVDLRENGQGGVQGGADGGQSAGSTVPGNDEPRTHTL